MVFSLVFTYGKCKFILSSFAFLVPCCCWRQLLSQRLQMYGVVFSFSFMIYKDTERLQNFNFTRIPVLIFLSKEAAWYKLVWYSNAAKGFIFKFRFLLRLRAMLCDVTLAQQTRSVEEWEGMWGLQGNEIPFPRLVASGWNPWGPLPAGACFKLGLHRHLNLLLWCYPTGLKVLSVNSLWNNWHHFLKGCVEFLFPQHRLPWICQVLNVCLQRNEVEKVHGSHFQLHVLLSSDTLLTGVNWPVNVNSTVCFEN